MSWFDDNGIPTNSAPNAGVAAGPGGSLGSLGSPSVTTTHDPNVYTAQGTAAGAPTTAIAPQTTPYPTNWTSPASSTGGAMPTGGSTSTSFGNLSDPSAWMGLVGNQQQLAQWVQQQNPHLSPDLVNYYASKIQGQPGANPTEQAGSANYWMQKIQSDPTTGGGQGGGAQGGGGNPSGIPGLDPGYAFQVQQAQQAIQRSAASKGTLLTGGTLKGLADYVGNDMASSAYQGAFNRNYSLATLGENAAAGQGQNNTGYANSTTNALTNNANVQGGASIAGANIASNAINNATTGYTLSKLFPSSGSFKPNPAIEYDGGG